MKCKINLWKIYTMFGQKLQENNKKNKTANKREHNTAMTDARQVYPYEFDKKKERKKQNARQKT